MNLDIDTVASTVAGATAGGIGVGWVAKAMLSRFLKQFDGITDLVQRLDKAAAVLSERDRVTQANMSNLTAELARHGQSLDSIKVKIREIDVAFDARIRELEKRRK